MHSCDIKVIVETDQDPQATFKKPMIWRLGNTIYCTYDLVIPKQTFC